MKRQIKFRVWDNISKKMHDWNAINGNPIDSFNLDHYTLMQFIGLSDQNGFEIYEGDIVDHAGWRCKVVYGIKCSGFSLIEVKEGETDLNVISQVDCKYIRVIGNIYQNPELL